MDSQSSSTPTRGSIIKVPDATPGIVLANGQQRPFTLEGVWKSPTAPAVNMTVDIETDSAGAITGLTVVDQQQLAKERMSQLSGAAQERGKEVAKIAQQGVGALSARMGAVPLGAAALVVVSVFFLPAAGVSAGMGALGTAGNVSWTFWNLLGISFSDPRTVMGGGSSLGILSLLALVAMAAPFAAPFITAAWSRYLNFAPLAIVAIGFLDTWMGERKAFSELTQIGVPNPFSWSWGFYILALAAVILATQKTKSSPAH